MKQRRWLGRFGAVFVTLILVAIVGRWLFFQGPYRPIDVKSDSQIIDIHCHTAGIGGGNSGCFCSKAMRDSYKFDIYLKSFGTSRAEITAKGDSIVVQRISESLSKSQAISHAVLLAIDGRVDDHGDFDAEHSEIFVPNEFVAREVRKYTNLLFGASINPMRKDALDRLDWAATNGAVLVKWIPSIMHIDPSDERITPFYQRLVKHGIILLCHAGQERSFTSAQDELCDPERLRLPLKLGVTVVAAHIASTGNNHGERDTDRLARMMKDYPNLYSEISSITQVNKLGYLKEAITRPEFANKLCYGSDFPLINTALVSPWFFPMNLRRSQMSEIAAIENPWDRDVALKQALGVPRDVFERTSKLIQAQRQRFTMKF